MFSTPIRTALVALVAISASASVVCADETRIRQADQNREVDNGAPGCPLLFTATGYLNDQFCSPFANGTIAQLCTNPYVYDVVHHSGGQTSIRFCVPNPNRAWNQSTVWVQRGSTVIDRDRVIVR